MSNHQGLFCIIITEKLIAGTLHRLLFEREIIHKITIELIQCENSTDFEKKTFWLLLNNVTI